LRLLIFILFFCGVFTSYANNYCQPIGMVMAGSTYYQNTAQCIQNAFSQKTMLVTVLQQLSQNTAAINAICNDIPATERSECLTGSLSLPSELKGLEGLITLSKQDRVLDCQDMAAETSAQVIYMIKPYFSDCPQ